MLRLLLAACLLGASSGATSARAQPTAETVAADRAAIAAVIENFRTAIIAKDRATLESLTVSPDISFMASIDPVTLAWVRTRRADAKRLVPGSYGAFVDEVVTSKVPIEETIDDIEIATNGSVASASFAYQYKEDGAVSNWGDEHWGLIATDDGWKISSVIWSMTVKPTN